MIATTGANWSAIADDGLVAVGGMVCTDDGTGVWLLFTDKITPGRFVAIYRELARGLATVIALGEPVFIHVDPNYPEARRLAERLGFRLQRTEVFDDGRDMIRMVIDARLS